MALDYSVLQGIDPGGAFLEGRERAAERAERNMLRQMQMEQMAAQRENVLAQRQEREAHAEERRLSAARRQEEDAWLGKMADLFGQNNMPLTPETVQQGLAFALRSRNAPAIQMMQKTVEAMQARQRREEEERRIFGAGGMPTGTQPPAATAVAPATAPAGELLAGTPFATGINALAPARPAPAVAAAPTNVLGISRDQALRMSLSSDPDLREQGKTLLAQFPKEAAPPAPSEVVRLNRELAEAQAAGNTALVANIQARIARLTEKPQPTQVIIPPQEKAEKAARGAMLVKDFEAVKQTAAIAAKTLPAIDSNLAILDKGFDTGFGTEAKTAAARVLSALGVKDAEKYAANSETFLANATQGVLQRQLEQKGPQTEADAQRITQTGAQLGNTKTGNRFLLSVAKAQLKRDVAQRDFYANWYKKNGTYDGAEDAWLEGEGGKSLFDRPELKPYADMTPTQTPAAGRARPSLDQIFKRKGQGGG